MLIGSKHEVNISQGQGQIWESGIEDPYTFLPVTVQHETAVVYWIKALNADISSVKLDDDTRTWFRQMDPETLCKYGNEHTCTLKVQKRVINSVMASKILQNMIK